MLTWQKEVAAKLGRPLEEAELVAASKGYQAGFEAGQLSMLEINRALATQLEELKHPLKEVKS